MPICQIFLGHEGTSAIHWLNVNLSPAIPTSKQLTHQDHQDIFVGPIPFPYYHCYQGRQKLQDYFQGAENPERVLLAVGREGGWTPYELEHLQEHGFDLFGMGKRILRTDTACIGLLSTLTELLNHGIH